jgi:hypothetical protein
MLFYTFFNHLESLPEQLLEPLPDLGSYGTNPAGAVGTLACNQVRVVHSTVEHEQSASLFPSYSIVKENSCTVRTSNEREQLL